MKACVLIPVLNESLTIGHIVEAVKKLSVGVVVVDDGSVDGSGDIAQKNGAVVIRHHERQGKGRSLQDGFEYALKKKYDCVITMDGDGQHDSDDIQKFFNRAERYPNSIVAGSRMEDSQSMPVVRLVTNRFMSWMISLACKQKIPDTQCGFRLISAEVLRHIQLSSSDYEIETEVLMKAAKKGFKIYSVPIKTIYRDEKSKINPVVDTIRFFKFFFRELWTPRA